MLTGTQYRELLSEIHTIVRQLPKYSIEQHRQAGTGLTLYKIMCELITLINKLGRPV